MNLKTRIKELAAKAEAVTEFARGDFAKKLVQKISHQTSYKERPWVANNLEKSIHEKFGGAQWATADLLRGLRKRHNGFMPRNTVVAGGQIESRFESSEAVRELARGDYLTDNARKLLYTLMPKHRAGLAEYKVNIPARGTKEAIEEARSLRNNRKLKPVVGPKPYAGGNWVPALRYDDNWGKR